MDQVIACPKCTKKYRVARQNLGKPMKCPACTTVFKAMSANQTVGQPAAPAGVQQPASRPANPAPASVPAAPPAEWKRFGLDGPLPAPPGLFPQTVPVGNDPLANHVVMDPGFVQVDIEAVREARLAKEKKQLASDPTRNSSSLADMEEAARENERKQKTSYLSAHNLFGFEGRISRKKYWLSILYSSLMMNGVLFFFASAFAGVLILLDIDLPKLHDIRAGKAPTGILVTMAAINTIAGIISAWIGFALGVKRYHDIGHSGTRILLSLIPVVGFWVVYECGFIRGVEGRNEYGPDPLKEK